MSPTLAHLVAGVRRLFPPTPPVAVFPPRIGLPGCSGSRRISRRSACSPSSYGPTAHACFPNLVQPFFPITWRVDLLAGTGNATAAIRGLEPIHHPRQLFADDQITARQLLQRSQAPLSVVDGPRADNRLQRSVLSSARTAVTGSTMVMIGGPGLDRSIQDILVSVSY